MPTFQEMFSRDYDQELRDVEKKRVDQVQGAEREGEAERQGLMQQLATTTDTEQRMWIEFKVKNSFGNEDKRIEEINDQADKEKKGIQEDRKANEQQREEAAGLKVEKGPAPDPGAPANVNEFAVVPPTASEPPKEPPKQGAKESEQAEESSTFMQGLGSGIKAVVGDAVLNIAAVGVALTTQVQSILETVDHESAMAAMNREKLAVTQLASDIKPDSMLVKPPTEEGEVDEDSTARYVQQEHAEVAEGIQSAINAEKNTPALVQNQPEERVMTHVFGIPLMPPPPPPPPPANDNEKTESKSK